MLSPHADASSPVRDEAPLFGGRLFLPIGAVWALAALILLAVRWHAITTHNFADVDDQLRLVEVRDWLNGQSFYDVTQYRMNQPWGAPMHWSRLVDMPLAALILLFRPLVGANGAEMLAVSIVPLMTLGVILLLAGLVGRRLADAETGAAAAALVAMSTMVLVQTTPTRIDHHGWEIALSMLALFAALDSNGRRSGLLSGVAAAIALQISLEPLPFILAIAAVFGIDWGLDPSPGKRQRLTGFSAALLMLEFSLFLLLHAQHDWSAPFCDSVSPPQLLAIGIAGGGTIALTTLNPRNTIVRFVAMALIGAAALAAYHSVPPHCGADAFTTLEPNVRTYWYEHVLEGQPIWRGSPGDMALNILFPLMGLACAGLGFLRADPERRWAWGVYLSLLVSAVIVGILVQRACGLASAAAAPGVAWSMVRAARRSLASDKAVVRVLGTSLIIWLLSPVAPLAASAVISHLVPSAPDKANAPGNASTSACEAAEHVSQLEGLPDGRFLATLDLAPPLLLYTRHAALASSHHRNHAAMSQLIAAFMGSPQQAHDIMRQRELRYVIICPDKGEVQVYQRFAPHGFAAQLVAGKKPAWLQRIRLKDNPIMVWRAIS